MDVATLDIVIVTVVLLSAAIGLVRGLVKEVLSLVAWVLAFVLAIYFSPLVGAQLPAGWGSESVRIVIGFALVFIGTLILASIVQWLVAQLITSTGLSGTDRFLGMLFGSARGLLVAVVMLMGLQQIASEAQWWHASLLKGELLAFEDDVRALFGQAQELIENSSADMERSRSGI